MRDGIITNKSLNKDSLLVIITIGISFNYLAYIFNILFWDGQHRSLQRAFAFFLLPLISEVILITRNSYGVHKVCSVLSFTTSLILIYCFAFL